MLFQWIEAIRAEEALATPDQSMTAMEKWDDAYFTEQDAQKKAQEARDAYKDGLRKSNYGFDSRANETNWAESQLTRCIRQVDVTSTTGADWS